MTAAIWDGVTRRETLKPEWAERRTVLADCAWRGDWAAVVRIVDDHRDLANATRLDGRSWYAPLHQAAHGGAPPDVVERLIALGAWRTLPNARGERPVDVARRMGHAGLLDLLEPAGPPDVPADVLRRVQDAFHAVIRGRAGDLVDEHALRLPELAVLLEAPDRELWFPIPGMYGGFGFRFETVGADACLVTKSWCRVVGGSGQRHRITTAGAVLVDEGFV